MNLYLVFKVLLRHKLIISLSILIGIWMAISAYSSGGYTTYEGTIRIMLNTPNSAVVSLASAENADLNKLMQIAPIYSVMLTSEPVLKEVSNKMDPLTESITAQSVEKAPIIEVTIIGNKRVQVEKAAILISQSFIKYIIGLQEKYKVANESRIGVSVLAPPTVVATQSRTKEIALIMFLIPVVIAVSLSFVIENYKQSKKEQQALEALTTNDAENVSKGKYVKQDDELEYQES